MIWFFVRLYGVNLMVIWFLRRILIEFCWILLEMCVRIWKLFFNLIWNIVFGSDFIMIFFILMSLWLLVMVY